MPAIYYNKYNRKHFRAVWLNRRRDETLKWESVPGKQLRQLIPFRGGRRPPTTSANKVFGATPLPRPCRVSPIARQYDWFEWVKPNGNEMGLLWVQIGEFHRILARLGPRLRFPDSFFAFRPNLAKMAAYLWTGLVWNGVGDRSLERLGSPFQAGVVLARRGGDPGALRGHGFSQFRTRSLDVWKRGLFSDLLGLGAKTLGADRGAPSTRSGRGRGPRPRRGG